MPSEVERVAIRVDRIEKQLLKGLPTEDASGSAVPDTVREIVVDTSKFEEHAKQTESVISDIDSKLSSALDELSTRVSDLEQLKGVISTVDGLSLHLELLHKRISQLEEKVISLISSSVQMDD